MRKIVPYRRLQSAVRALDNGGRFFNLFTHAGDQIVTRAELAKFAGIAGGLSSALLFFEMATQDLDESDRVRLVGMMDAKLRRKYKTHRPEKLTPTAFTGMATAGKPYIVEGHAIAPTSEKQVTGFITVPIIVGTVTTYSMIPVTEMFDVYRLVDSPARKSSRTLLTVKKGSGAEGWGRVRWAGFAKAHRESKDSGAGKRTFLEPAYYTLLD